MRNSGLEPECSTRTLESESSASTNSASSALWFAMQPNIIIYFAIHVKRWGSSSKLKTFAC